MNRERGFALWITGLPASGKSSITAALVKKLAALGISAVVLESDEMRNILTPEPTYSQEERDRFYREMVQIGALLARQGINVIFDATANKRSYRDQARDLVQDFSEVYVHCPIDVCMQRDPKGIYARGASGGSGTVPGMQAAYEPPISPDIIVDGRSGPEQNADLIVSIIKKLHHI